MGIRAKFVLSIVGIAAAVMIATNLIVERSNNQLIQEEALRVAEVVSNQVVADRAEYTENVVGKLKRDGFGAARNDFGKKGFVELPAQFVRFVSMRVAEQAKGLYSYGLVSQWNLNQDQGLKDDFQQWAWEELVKQDESHTGNPGAKGHEWLPAYRVESVNGQDVLRYMRADPASAAACVSCHNDWEKKPEIMAMRSKAGVTPGKQWELHQLMGAIEVNVPLKKVQALAASGKTNLLLGLAATFVIGFTLLFFILGRSVINPVQKSAEEITAFSETIDEVVGCSRKLLSGAEGQLETCRSSADVVMAKQAVTADGESVIDPHEERRLSRKRAQAFDAISRRAEDSAMVAEEAAVHCSTLEGRFAELTKRLNKVLGRKG